MEQPPPPDPYRDHLLALASPDATNEVKNAAVTKLDEVILPVVKPYHRRNQRSRRIGYHEDIAQCARLAVFEAAKNYDPSRPAAPFIATVARHALDTLLKASFMHKRNGAFTQTFHASDTHWNCNRHEESVTALSFVPDNRHTQPEVSAIVKDAAALIADTLRNDLTPLEWAAWKGVFLDHDTYEQIAARNHVAKKSVDNAIERAKLKIARMKRIVAAGNPDDPETRLFALLRSKVNQKKEIVSLSLNRKG